MLMNMKKNAIMWSVVLAVVLIGAGALYLVTNRQADSGTDSVPGSYSLDEVRMASTTERCWAVIKDGVYDLTPFVKENPRIASLCGTDATLGVSALGEGSENNFSNLRIGSLR